MRLRSMALVPFVAIAIPATAQAQSARDLLTQAAFQDRSGSVALAHIDRARATALTAAQRDPGDQDAAVLAAIAACYRAKLTGNRAEAIAARKQIEVVVTRFPRNPEAQAGLAAWHLGIIARVGRFVGRAAAGAREGVGLAALDRSVALGGDRAFFTGLAGLLRLNYDAGDDRAAALLDAAVRAPAPTPLDRIVQRSAVAVLAPLRRGDQKAAGALADRLLPLGWYDDKTK